MSLQPHRNDVIRIVFCKPHLDRNIAAGGQKIRWEKIRGIPLLCDVKGCAMRAEYVERVGVNRE